MFYSSELVLKQSIFKCQRNNGQKRFAWYLFPSFFKATYTNLPKAITEMV